MKLKVNFFAQPMGIKNELEVDVVNELAHQVACILEAGYRFEIEELLTGELGVSCDGFNYDMDKENYVKLKTCKYNEEEMRVALQWVIEHSFTQLILWGAIPKSEAYPEREEINKEAVRKKALNFQELLRVVNCLSLWDFNEIFSEGQAHYWAKFCDKGAFSFICYLDSSNMAAVYEYCTNKMINTKKERNNG